MPNVVLGPRSVEESERPNMKARNHAGTHQRRFNRTVKPLILRPASRRFSIIDPHQSQIASLATAAPKKLPWILYCDVRQNGFVKFVTMAFLCAATH
jgi:hypothetical protein